MTKDEFLKTLAETKGHFTWHVGPEIRAEDPSVFCPITAVCYHIHPGEVHSISQYPEAAARLDLSESDGDDIAFAADGFNLAVNDREALRQRIIDVVGGES